MSSRGPGSHDALIAQLTPQIEPMVTAAGYDLEELVVRTAGQRLVVRVVIDRDEGVSLDEVAAFSTTVSGLLDGADAFGSAAYVLEVTSPGIDRPLTLPRHWGRNVGRLVTAVAGPAGRTEQLSGRILRVEDAGVTLTVEKGGAKKGQVRRVVGERTIGWAELGEARIEVEFNRPAGHRDAGLVHQPDEDDDSADDNFPADELDAPDADEDDPAIARDDEHATAAAGAEGDAGAPAARRAPRGSRQQRGGTR